MAMTVRTSGSLSAFFDQAEIPIKCPKCLVETPKSLSWLQANDEMICDCGAHIRFNKDQFTGPVNDAQDALQKLKDTLDNFGR